jgi:RHS repeat-associated protein
VTTTEWRYAGRHLIEVIHPTQSERFEVDARGLRTARIVTLNQTTAQPANTPQGALTGPVIVPVNWGQIPIKYTIEVTAQNPSKGSGSIRTAHAAAQTGARPDKPFEFHLRFAGQYEDTETGWHYNWHRFYDPDIGRYLTPDPIGLKGGDNAYGYAGGDPLGAVDPWGLRAIVVGNVMQIRPEDLSVPPFDIPNTMKASGFDVGDINFHYYDVTAATRLSACQVGQSLRNNPTPGNDSPASANGTRNNVGTVFFWNNNFVRSFYIPSPNPAVWTDITVNYTIPWQHELHEGFVIRFGRIEGNGSITMRSYGEGQDAQQNMVLRPIWGAQVEAVWQDNYREIEQSPSSCGCQ